jgi:plastocyanin
VNSLHFQIAALLLAGASGVAAQAPEPETVKIVLSSYRYDPSPILLHAGHSVRLAFENKAGKGHDFAAPEFFAAARIVSGQVRHGVVDVAPGESKVVEVVPAAGTYPVHCSKFLHASMGMKTEVVVR